MAQGNSYVRNGRAEHTEYGWLLYGTVVSDPRYPIPGWGTGTPREMILHIAGKTYYPTRDGYAVINRAAQKN